MSTKVSVRIGGPPQASAINFIRIEPGKSLSQIYNTKILLRRPKAIYFGQGAEQRPQTEKFCLNSEENGYWGG